MADLIVAGGSGQDGKVSVRASDNQPMAELIAKTNEAIIAAGQKLGRPGRFSLYDGNGKNTVNITSADGKFIIGGGGVNSRITARGKDGQPQAELIATDKESIIAAGQKGKRPGRLSLYDGTGKNTVNITSADARFVIGGGGANARVTARGRDGEPVAELIATDSESIIGAGQAGRPARVSLYDGNRKETIRLDASAGDILLFNADCAEEFDVKGPVEPGAVVILDETGSVCRCETPYDARVVGVVSGAGGFRPGIILDRKGDGALRRPVALMGKVFCLVDASVAAVRPGDLLTTAARPGHAMRAGDRTRAFGAVLGKALRALDRGTGLVPILVSLQ